MNKHYVSEFAVFMEHYLNNHPDVASDQKYGWDLFWKQQGEALPCDW